MAVHSKTRQRVRLIVILAVVGTICLATGFVLRKKQVAARIVRDRDAGYAALAAGEYFTALHKIGPYLQRNPNDPEALLKYASARRNVEEPNSRHLVDAIALYRRVLELQPDNAAAREQLLEIFVSGALNTEILSIAEKRDDPASLRASAIAFANQGNTKEAVSRAKAYLAKKPGDLRMHMFVCAQMLRASQEQSSTSTTQRSATTAVITEYVDHVLAQHPDEPQFELLKAYACGMANDMSGATKAIQRGTALPLRDIDHVRIAVDLLDAQERYDESLAVLEKAAANNIDVAFQRRLIARLFQARRFAEVITRLEYLDQHIDKADTDLLAHRAMALLELKKSREAERQIDVLKSRKGNFDATAWAAVLEALPIADEMPDDRRIIEACRDGLRGEAENPYFRKYLGDAFSRIGESEAAAEEWAKAARAAPGWSKPLQPLLRLALDAARDRGRVAELADRGERLAAGDAEMLALVAFTKVSLAKPGDPEPIAKALETIDRVQEVQPAEPETLDLKVRILAETAGRERAKTAVQQFLSSDKSLPVAAYLALARGSEIARLGLEEDCFKRCLSAHPQGDQAIIARAYWLARAGRANDAVKYLEISRANASDRDSITWRRAYGQLLDLAQDGRAAKYWAELADSRPDCAVLQHDVLAARSTKSDRELVRRAIDRLRKVMGDQGVNWKLADARWILQGAVLDATSVERERDVVKATALLSDIARKYPEQLEVRLLLSECLFQLGKKEPAIENLTVAARLSPRSLPINVQLAALLQSTNDFERALPYLDQAKRILEQKRIDAAPTPERPSADARPATQPDASQDQVLLRALAGLYAARGDIQSARALLDQRSSAGVAQDPALAELLARRGELDDNSIKALMESPTLAGIEIVAEQYARAGRAAEAEGVLAKLDQVQAQPGQRELVRGLYLQRNNDLEAAEAQLRAACRALPASAQAWRALITCLIQLGRSDETIAAAAEAARALPDETMFARVVQNEGVVRENVGIAVLRPLAAALLDGSSDPDVTIAALTIARNAYANGEKVSQVAGKLRPLADRSPTMVPLQFIVIDLYASSGDFDNAVNVASRAARFLPADPAPARKYAETLAVAGRWEEVIAAATQWRGRLGVATRPADELLARAYLATGKYDTAIAQLQQYLSSAQADPLRWDATLAIYAQALLANRRVSEAEALLRPMLTLGARPRALWIALALSARDTQVTARWLDEVEPLIPADAIAERSNLAQAWQQFSGPGQSKYSARAEAQIASLSAVMQASSDVTAQEWMVLGFLKEARGNITGAEAAYREALKRDANFAPARNNIAMLLVRNGGDLNEALRLAQQAVADTNNPARAEFLDTLGQVQLKAGKSADAEGSFAGALMLQPQNLRMRANLVEALLASNKADEAHRQFQELEKHITSGVPVDASLAPRIEQLRAVVERANAKTD